MLTDHSIFSKSTEELNALDQMLKCRTKAALFIIKTKQIFYYKVTNIPGRDCAGFMLPLLSVKSVKISVNQSNPDLSQPLGEVSCSGGLEIAHFAGGHCHVLPRAAWTVISSSEQVSFSQSARNSPILVFPVYFSCLFSVATQTPPNCLHASLISNEATVEI